MALSSSILRWSARVSSLSAAMCSSSGTRISPISPPVQVTMVTPMPSATYFAMVAPLLMLSSSGWACTRSRCLSMGMTLVASAQRFCQWTGERSVGGEPVHLVELVGTQPPDRVVLAVPRDRLAVHQRAEAHTEDEVVADLHL